MTPNASKPFLTLKECANESGIALYWWRQAVKNNHVPFFRSGNKFYVDYDKAIEKIRGGLIG